jgi:4-hydroxy-tetrahydrodipicolinate synthase
MIDTRRGPVAVGELRVGDRVLTRDNGFRTIRWIGSRTLDAAALAGDWDQVEALQTQLDTFGAIVQKGRSLAQSLAALKAACAAQGLCTRDVLPPLVPLDAAAFATVQQDCAALGLV